MRMMNNTGRSLALMPALRRARTRAARGPLHLRQRLGSPSPEPDFRPALRNFPNSKISIHVAVVAGAIVILVLVFGPMALCLAPVVLLTGWARVTLGDHTPGQAIAGGVLGTLVAAGVFSFLR